MCENEGCQHDKIMPEFDQKAAAGLSSDEVRKRWPRFGGLCPDCGTWTVAYASYEHYLAGDW